MKTLKDFLEVYEPKAPDEKKFKDKHVTIKFKDRNEVNGKNNDDDVFNASDIKPVKRKDNRQGYDVGDDEKVYEETDIEESLGMGYKPTSEKSKFDDGHRAKLLNPDGKLSYLSQKSYATPAHAKAAAKYYHSIGHLPSQTIDSKMRQYNKDYDTKKESVEADEINNLLDEALAILEKTLTPAELKKREEIAKAIGRGNPKMPMAQKMAIATAQAKKVAEEVDHIDEISADMADRYLKGKRERDWKRSDDGSYSVPRRPQSTRRKNIDARGTSLALRTIQRPRNMMAKEEVEEIDESAKIVAHLQKRYGDNIRKSHVMSAAKDFGVDASKLAKAVRTKLGKNMLPEENDDGWYTHKEMYNKIPRDKWKQGWRYNNLKDKPFYHQPSKTWHASVKDIKEEVEAIDELSRKTLGSYVKKASNQAFSKGVSGGLALASRDPEVESQGVKIVNKAAKRMMGVQKAAGKLAKEESEVPFEGPYRKSGEERKDQYGNPVKNVPRHLAKQAMKALTKEDIINRAVEKYIPEELKYTPEERMIRRLEGLREGHIDMLMSLFETLNDDNQLKMISAADTQEGRNRLLDFAINNRGE